MNRRTSSWSAEIAKMVTRVTGVQFGDGRELMLEARLQRRMIQLGIINPEDYLEYVRSHAKEELSHLVTVLTSHHTFFFREYRHFQMLADLALRPIVAEVMKRPDRTLRIWSAACSQGQEAYSLAMFVLRWLAENQIPLKLEVLGTDVDTASIEFAKNGVYRWGQVQEIPLTYLDEFWTRGTGEIREFARANRALRETCRFEVDNLLDLPRRSVTQKYDLVFCRNVLIYFQAEQVKSVAETLFARLEPHGYLFIGVSESLLPYAIQVQTVSPSVYRHRSSSEPEGKSRFASAAGMKTANAVRPRVLCVDDSSTVLRLLKKILEPDYEVVGTASNGVEATSKMEVLKPDLITLDIHMPVQGGVEFLEKSDRRTRPPIVVISSVSREDSSLALKCLDLGAKDYIEKPDVLSLEWRADEIRAKLRTALSRRAATTSAPVSRAEVISAKPHASADSLRILVAAAGDRSEILAVLKEAGANILPLILAVEGAEGLLPALAKSLTQQLKVFVRHHEGTFTTVPRDSILLADADLSFKSASSWNKQFRHTTVMFFGKPSERRIQNLGDFADVKAFVNEKHLDSSSKATQWHARVRFIPLTSFAYHLFETEIKKRSTG